jgi:hypothetical protein
MATRNPFVNNPESAEVWELGYVAGFAEPETDHFLPLSEELAEPYQRGEQVGRDDRRRLPPGDAPSDGEEHIQWAEFGEGAFEFGFVHALGEGLVHLGLKAGGLIMLVFDVIQIPGDVSFKALEPDFEGPVDQEGESFVAICGRTDHVMAPDGVVTDDGYWVGPERDTFAGAAADRRRHQHTEGVVVRCSTADQTCGPVWPLQ